MYKKIKLKNGLPVIVAPIKGTKTVTALLVVGTGSKYENRGNNGLSHFLEHMLFKGTKKRSSTLAISSELDSIGAEYNAFTGKEYTGYWVKVQKEKAEKALEIIADILFNSKFSPAEIEREKGVITEEINMYLDNPMYNIDDVFEQCLYGDTPAGWDTLGTKENVASFKRPDFINYINDRYTAGNSCLCLVGNIELSASARFAKKYFSSPVLQKRNRNFQAKEAVSEKQAQAQVKIQHKKTDQVHLALGARSFSYGEKDAMLGKIISVILGGSMSSRLFINLREKNGLCYYIRTDHEAYSDSGYLATYAGVPADKTEKAVRIILSEYSKLKKTLLSAGELQKVKDYLRGKLAIQFEQSDNLANWYSRQAVMSLTVERETGKKTPVHDPEEYFRKIEKISVLEIRDAAKRIFKNSNLNLAMIGPFRHKQKFLGLLKL